MENESKKLLAAMKDRRTIRNPAEAFGDYWPTCATAVVYGLLYFTLSRQGLLNPSGLDGVLLSTFAVFSIALSAARDGKKEVHRKLTAIVRRLEEKELLGD